MSSESTRDELGIFTMTRLVRLVGAGFLVVSASTFMIQQWSLGNDVVRYLTLLGHTAILAAAGFFCGIKIKERRGARTFLGLVLISVPVHFAVLGGLLYSRFALDGADGAVPAHVMWTAKSPGEAAGLVALGLTLLVPMTRIAMTAFARPFSKSLTFGYLVLNAVLLVPVRGATATGLLVLISAMVFTVLQQRLFSRRTMLHNIEGCFARLALLIPIGIVVGRSVYLYSLSDYGWGMTLMAIGLTGFVAAAEPESRRGFMSVLQGTSALLLAVSWCIVAITIDLDDAVPSVIEIPVVVLPLTAALLAMSVYAIKGRAVYRWIAAFLTMFGMIINLLVVGGGVAGLLSLSAGVFLLVYGVVVKQKLVIVFGSVAIAAGTAYHLHHMVHVETLSHWAVLSVIGVLLILGASVFDRRSARVAAVCSALRKQLSAWDF